MQFIRYESFRQYIRFYPITTLFIAINLLLFIAMVVTGKHFEIGSVTLLNFGAMYRLDPQSLAFLQLPLQPELWRYVAAIFLHLDVYHLLFNSFALLVFAPPLERAIGPWRYILFYLAAGIIGNIFSESLRSDYVGAGASGAIYGIYAAYLFMSFFGNKRLDPQSRQIVITILVVGVLYSIIIPGVDLLAHLGGFVGGLLLMAVMAPRKKPKPGE